MRLKNEIFASVLDWLIQEKKVDDQKDLALKTGISQNTVSRIMTGKVEPSDDTLRKLNATFGNIFNMQYLRGESAIMLIEDVAYYKSHPNELMALRGGADKNKDIDPSSLVNAVIAAKDEEIYAYEKTIRAHEQTIASQLKTIESLERENVMLRQQIGKYQADEIINRHPFPVGVAEPANSETEQVKV